MRVEAFAEAQHGRLGHRVHRGGRSAHGAFGDRGEGAVAGARVDDVALVLRHQQGDESLDPVDDAEHVDVDAPLPVGQVVLPQVTLGDAARPGVVAHHVHRPVQAAGLVGEMADRLEVGHVGRHTGRVDPLRPERLDGARQGVLQDVGEDDLHPLLPEPPADGRSDATGAPGHHGHLPVQRVHDPPPSGRQPAVRLPRSLGGGNGRLAG